MKVELTEDEKQLLALLPQSIGSAMAMAGKSGLFGTGKEMFAAGQAMLAGAKNFPGNELIRDLIPDPTAADRKGEFDQMKKTRDWASERMKSLGIDSAEKFTAQTLKDVQSAGELLAKVGAQNAEEYKRWTMSVAETVANAASEGGFLGFGGERLSENEKKLLADFRKAFGLS